MQPARFNPRLPSLVYPNQEIEQGAQEGQEKNDQDPQNFFIPLKLTGEGAYQGNQRKEENKKDHQQCDQDSSSKKK
jgi:hypothetical protein